MNKIILFILYNICFVIVIFSKPDNIPDETKSYEYYKNILLKFGNYDMKEYHSKIAIRQIIEEIKYVNFLKHNKIINEMGYKYLYYENIHDGKKISIRKGYYFALITPIENENSINTISVFTIDVKGEKYSYGFTAFPEYDMKFFPIACISFKTPYISVNHYIYNDHSKDFVRYSTPYKKENDDCIYWQTVGVELVNK